MLHVCNGSIFEMMCCVISKLPCFEARMCGFKVFGIIKLTSLSAEHRNTRVEALLWKLC